MTFFLLFIYGACQDHLCGLVVRVPGCILRGPGFDYRRYHIFCVGVGLERDSLSLVRINEELPERKVAAPVKETEIKGRAGFAALTKRHSCIRKS
jgi:hypothetical protein